MDWDDIIYLLLLFISIGCGHFYRKIENAHQKKVTGSLIGLGIIILVSGFHTLHILLVILVNIIIILFGNKRTCHITSFVFTFSYLLFFRTTIYFGIPYPPGHTNLIIMILALKLVGLAFEMNTVYARKAMNKKDLTEEEINEHEITEINPKFMDIVHYAFNYVGILTGPYYSYRTYWDSMYMPYAKNVNCDEATKNIFKSIPFYAVLFFLITYIWPLSYALSDEFYDERSLLYRFWYTIPIFWMFRLRIYIGILLSVCVCSMAGFGAYPTFTDPKPGRGPSTNFTKLNNIDESNLSKEEYNFETVQNINVYRVEVCTTFRESMKHWNMTVQYWMAVNIYKRFPSKKFRTLVTLFVSSFWHGVYIGHYFTISGAPFYLPVEDLYFKLFVKEKQGKSVKIWEWIIYFSKWVAFSYLGMAFQLLTVTKVLRFYNSIYHIGAIINIVLYVIGVMLVKSRPRKQKIEGEGKKSN